MRKSIKYFVIFLLIIYVIGVIVSVNIFGRLDSAKKEDIKRFILDSIDNYKLNNRQYINGVVLTSLFSLLIYISVIILSSFSRYLLILNVPLMLFKGFSFGITSSSFFLAYGTKGLLFFITYIFFKELIVLFFLIILILYSITSLLYKDRFAKSQNVKSRLFIVLIAVVLSSGIIFIDRVMAPFACGFLK